MIDLAQSSAAELIERALHSSFEADDQVGDVESAHSWQAIAELHKRDDHEILEVARSLLLSDDAWHRSRGASILGQFGFRVGAFAEDRFNALTSALTVEHDPRVQDSLIYAIGHLDEARSVSFLLPFTKSGSSNVRLAVASTLNPDWGTRAAAALMDLMTDQAASVRDWATFAFTLYSADGPEIREALAQRLYDVDPDTRAEAASALAKRGDLRCLEEIRLNLGREGTCDSLCYLQGVRFLLGVTDTDKRSPQDLLAELNRIFPQQTK
jgi:HEAT repeat protein